MEYIMKFALLLIHLFVGVISPFSTGSTKEFSMTIASREPFTTTDRAGFLDQIIAEMFRRAGAKGKVTFYQSSVRALANANSGIDNGAGLRVKGLEKNTPTSSVYPRA